MAENSQAVIPDNLILVDGEIGLPSSTASDAGKVLAVDAEGDPSWVTPSGGTLYTEGTGIEISDQNVVSIDTTVVATKTDLSGLQGELTAGTGIDITNDTISVDTSVVATQTDIGNVRQVPTSTSSDENKVLTVNSSGNPVWATAQGGSPSDSVFRAVYGSSTYAEVRAAFTAGKSICLVDGDEDDGVIASDVTFADEDDKIIFSRGDAMNTSNNIRVDYTLARNGTWSTTSVTPRQVPASTSADETKVLTVNASGNPVWATAQGGTTYTAGNMISLANNAVAVSTTAGITDIQQVASLPANPVSTVLYLIPEA